MRVYLSSVLRVTLLGSVCLAMGACVTQIVTTPAQVATQTTQTAAQTAGQAAQVAIPDSDDKKELRRSELQLSQSKAGFLRAASTSARSYEFKASDKSAVKKSGRSNRQ